MPEGASYIVFLRGRATASGVSDEATLVVGGAQERVHEIPSWDYQFQCGLRIQPGAARIVLGSAAPALKNAIIPLREVWGARADRLLERLLTARADAEYIRMLSEAVEDSLCERADVEALSVALAQAVRSAPGGVRVSHLARELGMSVRTLERRFREDIGLAPKQYQRMARMAKVLNLVDGSGGDWASIAAACGYFDQSHLIDDCHGVLGRSPERFLRNVTNAESLQIGLVFERQPAD
jgi:AraC-like DNA-binding protein